MRIAVAIVRWFKLEEVKQFIHTCIDALFLPSKQKGNRRYVSCDSAMRKQSVLLDDVTDPPPQNMTRFVHDAAAIDADFSVGRLNQTIDHPQEGRLAGT